MGKIQKFLIIALALILLAVAVLTWGSIGSAVMVLCLLFMGAALLQQHFLNNRDDNDFQTDF